jgi:hypothetical protein
VTTSAPCATWRSQRPIWLVGLLAFTTFGLYFPVWMGITWVQLQRELNDDRMHPFWHALSFCVPLYGLFRIHAHCALLRDLLQRIGATRTVDSWEVLLGVMFQMGMAWLLVYYFLPHDPFKPLLWLSVAAAAAATTVHAQAGLNAYWQEVGPADAPPRVSLLEWLSILPCLGFFTLAVAAALSQV